MYKVEKSHYRPCYRKGDLEDEMIRESAPVFKTRKLAKEYIENELYRFKNSIRDYKKGQTSYCYGFTGKSWIHENTGEECEEYYRYKLIKL